MIAANEPSVIDLSVMRQIVASALAGALADPRTPLAHRFSEPDLQIIARAWNALCEGLDGPGAGDLGIGEIAPRAVTATTAGRVAPPLTAAPGSDSPANLRPRHGQVVPAL